MFDWRQWDSHRQRLVTGALLFFPLLAVIGFGPFWIWVLLLLLLAGLGLWELDGLLFQDGLPLPWLTFHIAIGLLFPLGAALGNAAGLHAALAASIFCGLFRLLAFPSLSREDLFRLSLLVLGWIYVPYLLSFALLIGRLEDGRAWIFLIMAIIIASDAGAYYCGRRFGRHKLYERISPKKTIEGSVGGLFASLALSVVFGVLFIGSLPLWKLLILSGILSLIGQVGDLMESMLKRICGKKDSSQILPGHGGILDRLDSLLFVFPAAWVFLMWMGFH